MKILSLDISSTNIGAALFVEPDTKPVWYSHVALAKSSKDRLAQRLATARSTVRWAIQKTSPDQIVIEAPMGGSRGKGGGRASTIAVISAFGVGVEACMSCGIIPQSIFPSKWQSAIGVLSRLVKAKALTSVFIQATLGKNIQQDAADAIAMGMAYLQDKSIAERI